MIFPTFVASNEKNDIMWQRIQTLYLGIATILLGSMFFSRIATIMAPEGEETVIMYYKKVEYLMFLIMVFSANAIALFSFKARILQMRLTVINIILLAALQIWLGVDFLRNHDEMVFSITTVFPLVALILDILAVRGIALDEAMVQSAYRLRSSKRHRK